LYRPKIACAKGGVQVSPVWRQLREKGYQIEFYSHAEAILRVDFRKPVKELRSVLVDLRIPVESLVRGGGGEAAITQGLRKSLALLEWKKHTFEIKKLIDQKERESISHEMDHVRQCSNGNLALEIEWNNKDPFFDRDLENFKRLHVEGAISVGIIITRGRELQAKLRDFVLAFAHKRRIESFEDLAPLKVKPTDRQREEVRRRMKSGASFAEAWADAFCSDKFGQATTHWRKLDDRVRRGVGNPCPLLLIGIPETVVDV
jgi:hypothetical protein